MAVPSMTLLHVGLLVVVLLTGIEGKKEAVTNVPYTWSYVGTSVTVRCPLRLSGCTGIKWKKINESGAPMPITNQPPGKFLTSDCDLVIKNVTQADAVYYQCRISGQEGGVFLFVVQSAPNCSTSPPATSKTTAENDTIRYECSATVYGIRQPRVTWYDKDGKQAKGETNDKSTGNNIQGTLSTVAKAPKVKTMQCYASFQSKAGNVSAKICETKEFKILYSVRNVVTWPLLFVGPGEELTCSADANPEASFIWLVKEEGTNDWVKASEVNGKLVTELQNGTSSAQYKCVAENEVRGIKYRAESLEVTVTKHGKTIRIAIIVTVCVVALLVIGGIIVWKVFFS